MYYILKINRLYGNSRISRQGLHQNLPINNLMSSPTLNYLKAIYTACRSSASIAVCTVSMSSIRTLYTPSTILQIFSYNKLNNFIIHTSSACTTLIFKISQIIIRASLKINFNIILKLLSIQLQCTLHNQLHM